MFSRIILIVAFLVMTTPVVADGFYVGGSLGVSVIDDTASTADDFPSASTMLPMELSISGRIFDSNETAWGAFIGWNANDWFAIEVSYTDLGNTGEEPLFAFFGPIPTTITIDTPLLGFDDFVGVTSILLPPNTNVAALTIEEWSIDAKFRKLLVSKLSANWSIGLTRAEFESQGSFTLNEVISLNPLVFNPVTRPFASPESEIGFAWGLGFAWEINNRISLDLAYRSHDTQVLDVDTVSLRVLFTM